MSSETRKAVPQFPFPPKELYEPFRDSSYVQDPPRPPDKDSEFVIFGVPRKMGKELLASLESQGHSILFKVTEKKTGAIKRLILCCLKRYMNILDNLTTSKPDWSTIEEELRLIEEQFVNIYHLLNILRLEQAKWRLYKLFNSQVSKKEDLAEKLRKGRHDVLLSLKTDTQDLSSTFDWKESFNSFLSHDIPKETCKEDRVSSERYWDMRETIESILNEEKSDV
ncbi:hypothetical protein Gasu2_60600 [Galdieria sulphuraria]|uniref:Mediator of RNA polymerase II transcription subunit 7 n=1 Tax=Galdieria sulphuraria TaxID=130081 RepID=M2W2I2_GALSU|nr:uncharacterized protein Gasu_26830 [Galdieria sulphuraria]EME29896.1 hypothetical protein Gasu_26830 [Galdieria sulphuraria]GJD11944.1 hypothetical protein Gasu2_60600 [Galdieria sulphuraria]|eukprot:XP_005706416.1 hypothetical protein Gasu_26830 [Galdieria sulphuraria]